MREPEAGDDRDTMAARYEALVADNEDLRQRNRALAIACERFRSLYEQTPTPQITVGPDGVILDVNDAAEILLCAPGADLLATRSERLFDMAGRERFRSFIDELFASGRGRCGDVVLGRAGEPLLDALIDGVVLPGEPGAPARAVLTVVDITARKLAEAARRKAQDEVLAIVSHDLRGPISSIGLACDGLDAALPADEHDECVAAIRRAVARSERLISDLLRVAHIESGRLKLERAPFDLRGLAEQVRRDHERAAAAVRSPLTVTLPADPAPVDGDRDRLHQVLSNLVGNALIHARGAAIEVRVAAHAGTVVVAVADEGPGIPPDQLPIVFERYRQGARRRNGAGLGLAIVKGLVEAHRGTVTVTSRVGAGTCFEIILPRAASSDEVAAMSSSIDG